MKRSRTKIEDSFALGGISADNWCSLRKTRGVTYCSERTSYMGGHNKEQTCVRAVRRRFPNNQQKHISLLDFFRMQRDLVVNTKCAPPLGKKNALR